MVVKLGIIGYKNHAKRLIDLIDKNKYSRLQFIYHPSKKLKDPRMTNDFKKLFSCDGVLIASPNNTHFNYLKKLKDYQGYIFCEKPPVTSVRELNSLKKLSNKKKQKIFFNFNARFKKFNTIFEKILSDPTLGNVINVNIVSSHGLAFKDEYQNSWRASSFSHSLLETVSIHFIDLLNLHFGKPIKIHYIPKNMAKTGIDFDTVNIHMIYKNKINIQILNSYASPLVNETTILTTNSWIVFRNNNCIIYHPRDTFDKNGFFKLPPIYKKFQITNEIDYTKSLKTSFETFIFHIKNNLIFNLKLFNTSLETNKIILDLKNTKK